MPSSSDKQQTTKTTTEPYKAAQPLLNTAMGDALKAYNNGNLVKSTQIDTAVPFSDQTKSALQRLEYNAAKAMKPENNPMQPIIGNMSDIWKQGGYNAEQQTALDALRPIASGDYLNRPDPNFEAVLARTKENAGTDVNSMLATMGRFAGGAHQGILADRLGGIEAQSRLDQYNMERDRQSDAINQLFGMGQAGQDNMASSGTVMRDLLAAKDAPANAMLNIGSIYEQQKAAKLNDKLRKADSKLTNLQALLGVAGGAGGYGTTRAQAPTTNNGWSNALGAGTAGLGLLSLLGGF